MSARGSSEFRLAMARQSGVIRELISYRCAPDQFRGDLVWRRVQEAAQQALDALHAAPVATGSQLQASERVQAGGHAGRRCCSALGGLL